MPKQNWAAESAVINSLKDDLAQAIVSHLASKITHSDGARNVLMTHAASGIVFSIEHHKKGYRVHATLPTTPS